MSLKERKILRILTVLLLAGSALAAVKMIFVDYTLDEEYQVVMAYRRISGDTLFGTMWEPHQTSAFLCAWLMRVFVALTGTTAGVVIWLRVCTTVIQLLLSVWLYRVMKRFLRRDYAFLLGVCYFNIVPKIIQIPEFSNMQSWFFTVCVLALLEYETGEWQSQKRGNVSAGRFLWLAAAGLGMALTVLAHPGSVILFPFFLFRIFLSVRSKDGGSSREGIADGLIFASVCAVCAVVWLSRVLSHVTWKEFLRNLSYAVRYDATHDISPGAAYRIAALTRDFLTLAAVLAVIVLLALFMQFLMRLLAGKIRGKRESAAQEGEKNREPSAFRKDGADGSVFVVWMVLAAELVQLFYWLVIRAGYEILQIHLIVVLLGACLLWRRADERKRFLATGFAGGGLLIAAVIYMSNLGIWYGVPHGMTGVLFGAAVILLALERQRGEAARFWAYLLLFSLAFVSVFGKGFLLRAGKTETNTVAGIGGVIRSGPAAGIFTNYMQAYITNSTYEEFQSYVKPGSNCLIVTNMIGTAGTSPYLFNQAKVCHFSVVDPTSYDERLLTYWELYPEKRPDVIVVDCWYGQLMEPSDSWIMQYIEGEFGYAEAVDGKYVRYYLKGEGK